MQKPQQQNLHSVFHVLEGVSEVMNFINSSEGQQENAHSAAGQEAKEMGKQTQQDENVLYPCIYGFYSP